MSVGRATSLASFAVGDHESRGRSHPETVAPPGADEAPFDVDRRRVVNCMSFRRLSHKTQVFVSGVGDHFRTRLTHTLEVALQAERLARALGLNARLAETIALCHDLGHSPFGHAGESALNELMREAGGFEHNLQSLRVVDYLEHPYPGFRGLNLSFEVREALVKHRTRYDRPIEAAAYTESGPSASLEGQVVNLADAIAYSLHDTEDGIGQAALDEDALNRCGLWRTAAAEFQGSSDSPARNLFAVRRPILDRLADTLIADATRESLSRIRGASVGSVDDVRRCDRDLVGFSAEIQTGLVELQDLLASTVYHNHRVKRMDSKAKRIIRDLFEAYEAEPTLLPERYQGRIDEQGICRVICDYIAGMTDRFCQQEHQHLFAPFQFD